MQRRLCGRSFFPDEEGTLSGRCSGSEEESEEYRNYKATAYAPEPINTNIRRVKRYDYEMLGIVMPTNADKNILIDYGIIEEDTE